MELVKSNLFIQIGYINNQFQNEDIYINKISPDEKKLTIKLVNNETSDIKDKELDINLLFCIDKNNYPSKISKSIYDDSTNKKIGYIESIKENEDNYKIIKLNDDKEYDTSQEYEYYKCQIK